MSLSAACLQRVLIAGGSRGIGLAIAEAFVRSGAHVSLCARNADGLAQATQALAAHGAPVHTFPCDLAGAAQIEAYVQAAAHALDGLDVVINNASGYGHGNDDASW
ncbi:3-oxoacyl-ACP reductase [Xanthomonas fragariae]|nr:3-oxoacyl-ACP reductase [Xanthomonas fragariae]